jgi:hypothetical protein
MSDAVVAPHCSITSGATGCLSQIRCVACVVWETLRTPVRAPNDSIIACCAGGCRVARDTKVGEFDGAIFGCQDVGTLDVSMDYTLVV